MYKNGPGERSMQGWRSVVSAYPQTCVYVCMYIVDSLHMVVSVYVYVVFYMSVSKPGYAGSSRQLVLVYSNHK